LSNLNKNTYVYEESLPEEPTNGLIELFRNKVLGGNLTPILELNDRYIYQKNVGFQDEKKNKYMSASIQDFEQLYLDLSTHDRTKAYESTEGEDERYLESVNNPSSLGLRSLEFDDGELTIHTNEAVKTFNSVESTNKKRALENVWKIEDVALTEDAFYLELFPEDSNEDQGDYLFLNQDLTNYTFIENTSASFEDFMETEEFYLYQDLFKSLDEENKFLLHNEDKTIIDVENKKLVTIDADDYLSADGNYVYINGDTYYSESKKIDEGKQKIQETKDYIEGNNKNDTTFYLDFKDIKERSEEHTSALQSRFDLVCRL